MRKRSRYTPRAVNPNPLNMMAKAPAEKRERVLATFRSALAGMTHGSNPGVEEWRLLSDVINTIETMALGLHKLDPREVMPTVNDCIAAMVRAKDRFQAGKGMRLDAEGIEAIRTAIDFYAQCLDGYTEFEMAQAQAETERRVNKILRSKSQTAERVCL